MAPVFSFLCLPFVFSIVLLMRFISSASQQRVKSASSAEHMKLLAIESSNADTHFQQLDKLRMIYEEYIKLGKETIPLAEKNLEELMEDLKQKTQAFDDVTFIHVLSFSSFYALYTSTISSLLSDKT